MDENLRATKNERDGILKNRSYNVGAKERKKIKKERRKLIVLGQVRQGGRLRKVCTRK